MNIKIGDYVKLNKEANWAECLYAIEPHMKMKPVRVVDRSGSLFAKERAFFIKEGVSYRVKQILTLYEDKTYYLIDCGDYEQLIRGDMIMNNIFVKNQLDPEAEYYQVWISEKEPTEEQESFFVEKELMGNFLKSVRFREVYNSNGYEWRLDKKKDSEQKGVYRHYKIKDFKVVDYGSTINYVFYKDYVVK